jgi:hypothetical protein
MTGGLAAMVTVQKNASSLVMAQALADAAAMVIRGNQACCSLRQRAQTVKMALRRATSS